MKSYFHTIIQGPTNGTTRPRFDGSQGDRLLYPTHYPAFAAGKDSWPEDRRNLDGGVRKSQGVRRGYAGTRNQEIRPHPRERLTKRQSLIDIY